MFRVAQTHYKNESVNQASWWSPSAVVIFFKGLYHGIPRVLSCSNYSDSAKTRRLILIIVAAGFLSLFEGFPLTNTLELGILTSPRIPVTLDQRLERIVLVYRSYLKLSIRSLLNVAVIGGCELIIQCSLVHIFWMSAPCTPTQVLRSAFKY